MIHLNFWLYLIIGFAFLTGFILGQGAGKKKLIDGIMERMEGMKGCDGRDAKVVTDLRGLLKRIARGEHVDESLR